MKAQIADVREIQKYVIEEAAVLLGPGVHRLILELQCQGIRIKARENFIIQIL